MAEAMSPDSIMQLGLGFWGSKTLLSAIEFKLFGLLAKGSLTAAAIGDKLGLHPRSRRDFLDALVALGMLEREGNGEGARYSNTPQTDLFLDPAKPTYAGGMLEMANARLYGFWGTLTDGLKTGKLQNEAAHGDGGLFSTLYADPAKLRQFLEGMTGLSAGVAGAIARQFPWAKYKTFIDVGAAQGAVPV